MMLPALGRSLLLAFLSIGLMLLIAIPLGILRGSKARRSNGPRRQPCLHVGVSLPEFVTATLVLSPSQIRPSASSSHGIRAAVGKFLERAAPSRPAGPHRLRDPDRARDEDGPLRARRRTPDRLRAPRTSAFSRRFLFRHALRNAPADNHDCRPRCRISPGRHHRRGRDLRPESAAS